LAIDYDNIAGRRALAESLEIAARQERGTYNSEMIRRHEYYNGVQFVQDANVIRDMTVIDTATWNESWTGPGWDDIKAMLPQTILRCNIQPVSTRYTRSITNAVATVYAVNVRGRRVMRDGEYDPEGTKRVAGVYEAANHNATADTFCKYVRLFDCCFQFYWWNERRKRFQIINIPPYNVYVVQSPDDPMDIQHFDAKVSIVTPTPQFSGAEREQLRVQVWEGWHYWFEDINGVKIKGSERVNPYFVPDDNGKVAPKGHPFEGEMGYPVKPIAAMQQEEGDTLFPWASDHLVQQNQRLDRDLTGISYTQERQGFASLVLSGLMPEDVQQLVISQGAPIMLGDSEASADYIHPVAPVGEAMSVAIKKARLAAKAEGVDPETVDPDSKVVSGVSRAQMRRDLMELRERQFKLWTTYERECYWLMSTIWNTHNEDHRQLPAIPRDKDPFGEDEWDVQTEFGDLEPVVDPLADTLTLKNLMEMNLTNGVEILMHRRRVTKPVAEQIYAENKLRNVDLNLQAVERTGQSGNRPETDEPDKPGGNISAAAGNVPT